MDKSFKEFDYSDITAKYFQNNINDNNNQKFTEIDIKNGNYGFIKIIIFIILFILIIILTIVAIVKSNNIKSIEKKIKDEEEQINSNKKLLLEKEQLLNTIEEKNIELDKELLNAVKEKEKMENNMKLFISENDQLKIDIRGLENEVEYLQQEFKVYDGFEKSELQLEYEYLVEKIEKLRQSPM